MKQVKWQEIKEAMLSQAKNRNLQNERRQEKDGLRVWELVNFKLLVLLSRCELSYTICSS